MVAMQRLLVLDAVLVGPEPTRKTEATLNALHVPWAQQLQITFKIPRMALIVCVLSMPRKIWTVDCASALQDLVVMPLIRMLDAFLVDPLPSRKRLAMTSALLAHLDLESWIAMVAHQLILPCVLVNCFLR